MNAAEKRWHPEIEEPEVAIRHYAKVASDYLRRAGIGSDTLFLFSPFEFTGESRADGASGIDLHGRPNREQSQRIRERDQARRRHGEDFSRRACRVGLVEQCAGCRSSRVSFDVRLDRLGAMSFTLADRHIFMRRRGRFR